MNEVRVLVLSPHNYQYGSKSIGYRCGDMFYLNPSSSPEDLAELKFILDSEIKKKGWIHIEKSIIEDYEGKKGMFSLEAPQDNQVATTIDDTSAELPSNVDSQPVDDSQTSDDSQSLDNSNDAPTEDTQTPTDINLEDTQEVQPADSPSVDAAPVDRKTELSKKSAKEVKEIATGLEITYKNKEQAISDILTKESFIDNLIAKEKEVLDLLNTEFPE